MRHIILTAASLILTINLSAQSNITSKSSVEVNINDIELSEKRPQSLNLVKGTSLDYDKIKGFVLTNATMGRPNFQIKMSILKKQWKDLIEQTPFEFEYKDKKIKYKEGYVYVSYTYINTDNNNFETNTVFRNHQKRTILSVNAVNITLDDMLQRIGLTTY
tara:strand:+ start:69 stop:551 length:483 start_codon:yes stop_codon:yes gene_type:complete